jgi:hypothetical protein
MKCLGERLEIQAIERKKFRPASKADTVDRGYVVPVGTF